MGLFLDKNYKMKKLLFFVLIIGFLTSCSKDDPDTLIQQYISDNNLTVEKTSEGVYYVTEKEGTGERPTMSDDVLVHYRGTFLNGEEFDSNLNTPENEVFAFNLSEVITGFGIGIQLFKEGGEGLLIIPPELAYGENPPRGSAIGKNEVLVFEIKFLGILPEPKVQIANYIAENNLDAQETSEGLFYVISKEGTGKRPTSTGRVTVQYEGKLINGQVFDTNLNEPEITLTPFDLRQLILGWQIGMPKFKEGGEGILIIPPNLAYGDNPPSSAIPPNAVLIFDIKLLEVHQ